MVGGCAEKKDIYKFSRDPKTQSLGSNWSRSMFLYSKGWVLEQKIIDEHGIVHVEQIPVESSAILYIDKDSISFLDVTNSGVFSQTAVLSKEVYHNGESLRIKSQRVSGDIMQTTMIITNADYKILVKHQLANNIYAFMVVDIGDIFYVD